MGHIAVYIYIYIYFLCNMPETLSKEYCIHSRTFFTGKDFSKYCCIYWSILLQSNVTFSQRNTKNHSPEVSVSQCISFWLIRKGPYIYIYHISYIYIYHIYHIYIYIIYIIYIYHINSLLDGACFLAFFFAMAYLKKISRSQPEPWLLGARQVGSTTDES